MGPYGGQQVGRASVIRWERRENRVLLREIRYDIVADSTNEMSRAVAGVDVRAGHRVASTSTRTVRTARPSSTSRDSSPRLRPSSRQVRRCVAFRMRHDR